MYLITILNTSGGQYQLSTDYKSLENISNLLESSESVHSFKISNGSGMLTQMAFGFGDFKKWQTLFYGPQD